jgi:integrase
MKLFRFHDLRHSHASHLLKAGVHPKIVSERLGHSTVGMTLDTYSHVLPGMQEEAIRSNPRYGYRTTVFETVLWSRALENRIVELQTTLVASP